MKELNCTSFGYYDEYNKTGHQTDPEQYSACMPGLSLSEYNLEYPYTFIKGIFFEGSCYSFAWFAEDPGPHYPRWMEMDWDGAEAECQRRSGHLVWFETQEEFETLSKNHFNTFDASI